MPVLRHPETRPQTDRSKKICPNGDGSVPQWSPHVFVYNIQTRVIVVVRPLYPRLLRFFLFGSCCRRGRPELDDDLLLPHLRGSCASAALCAASLTATVLHSRASRPPSVCFVPLPPGLCYALFGFPSMVVVVGMLCAGFQFLFQLLKSF